MGDTPTNGVYGTYRVFTENRLQPGRWAMGYTGRHRTHAHRKACPLHSLDQEPFCIREEGRLWEAGGPAVCPLWEAPEGWEQGVHRGRRGWALSSWPALSKSWLNGLCGSPVSHKEVEVHTGIHNGIDDFQLLLDTSKFL